MRIKTKLLLVFSTLFISMLLLLYFSIHTSQQLNRSVSQIVNEEYKTVELTQVARIQVFSLDRAFQNYVFSDSSSIKQQQMDKVNQARINATQALAELEKFAVDGQEKLIIYHIKNAGNDYLNFLSGILKKVQEGKNAEASKMLTDDELKHQQDLFTLLDDLVELDKLAMQQAVENSTVSYQQSLFYLIAFASFFVLMKLFLLSWLTKGISSGLARVSRIMKGFSNGEFDLSTRLDVESKDEIGMVSAAFNQMATTLELQSKREKEWSHQNQERAWLHENMTKVYSSLQNITVLRSAAEHTLNEMMPQLSASYGVVYLTIDDGKSLGLERMAGYALPDVELTGQKKWIAFGEGLIGQCALEKKPIELTNVPSNYIQIQSGLGYAPPQYILIIPLLAGDEVEGVLELACLQPLTEIQKELMLQLSDLFAVHINKIKSRLRIEQLLEQSQAVAEELQLQQEELAQMNAELEEHTTNLKESEHQLQIQQADLENINEEIREKSKKLEQKTHELSEAINYKSFFLANMSHELRTPLNSMLILAKHLADNKDNNLSSKEMEYASTVYSSGQDLLNLINEILDLAKVESKKIVINRDRIELSTILDFVKRNFQLVAQQRSLQFHMEIANDVPAIFYTDQQRVLQIIQNLLSNAFKFTERGIVSFSLSNYQQSNREFSNDPNRHVLNFSVSDTGVGIERDKQEIIFEAFVQADGTTNRKFGGTGLGLSISKQFAGLLGGEIRLLSNYGVGSTFTLILPVQLETQEAEILSSIPEPPSVVLQEIASTRLDVSKGLAGKTILLVDDDVRNVFALSSVMESYGLKVIYAENGREALERLERDSTIDGIIMDIMMPEMDGYEAMKRIRQLPNYKKIPILAVTAKAMKDDREKCIQAGASDYITKPVDMDQLLTLLKVWLYP